MIVDCWRRVLVFELPTSRQLCSNGSPLPSEDVPDGLSQSLSVDLSNRAWVYKRLMNKLSSFLCNLLVIVSMYRRFLYLAYKLPVSSLGCKPVCIVISFLVLCSICWSSSFIHFKNSLEYLSRGQPRCLSLGWDFLGTLFNFFFHLHLFDGVRSNISKYLWISFSPNVLILSLFGNSLPSVICCIIIIWKFRLS